MYVTMLTMVVNKEEMTFYYAKVLVRTPESPPVKYVDASIRRRDCIQVRLGSRNAQENKGNETDDRDEKPLASPVARIRDLWW